MAGRWVGTGDAVSYRDLLANFGWLFFGMSALAIGAVLLAWKAAVVGHLRVVVAGLALAGGVLSCLLGFDAFGLGLGVATAVLGALCVGRSLTLWSGWLGLLILGALINLVLMILGPPLSVAVAWPLLIGAFAISGMAISGRWATGVALVFGLIVCAHLGHLTSLIFTAVGPDTPEALALVPLLGALALYPLIVDWSQTRRCGGLSAILAGVGLLATAFAAAHDPASARTPHPVQAFYLDDKTEGKAWRASALPRLDPWSRSALGGQPTQQARAPIFDKAWQVPAPMVDLPDPVFQSNAKPTPAGQAVTLTIAPHAGEREVRLYLQPTVPLTNVALNGQPTELLPKPGAWVMLRWDGETAPLTLTFTAKAGGALDLRYEEIAEGWPAGIAAPPKPANTMPWGFSDDTVVIDRFQPQW